MSVLALKHLFEPRSIAVIGASNRSNRAGHVIMRNLLEGGFSGPIMPVNPKYRAVAGVLNYPDIESLPETPDLAVVTTRMSAVPAVIAKLNARGAHAAVVFANDPDELDGLGQTRFRKALLDAAGSHGLRILGTGSLGLLVPHAGLNASLSPVKAHPGKIAFVSQSGALCTAVLDWARPRGIGFSHFISLGDCVDVGFGDILDVLGDDPDVHTILLYIESLEEHRTFVAAARSAARNKPVLVVKAGEKPIGCTGQNRPATLTQAMVTCDDTYDAVIRRAGMLRVYDTDELFAAVETLARVRRIKGDRLAVLANGGGLSVMAIDALGEAEGRLAALSEAARHGLDEALGRAWSGTNPIELQADAPAERYAAALEVLLNDADVDATLVLHSPTALSSATDSARAVIASAARRGGVVMTSWIGGEKVAPARQMFADAGLPTYDTPGQAVRAFGHLVQYHRNQEVLLQTPASDPVEFAPRIAEARAAVDRALAESGGVLSGPTARAVLAAYDIPITKSRFVRTPEEARAAAVELGFPCALTVVSPEVLHKWEVGGVALQLRSDEAVEAAALARVGSSIDKAAAAGRISDAAAVRARLRPAAGLAQLSGCGLIIEAIIEEEGAKSALFRELGDAVPAEVVVATNTSCLSVSSLARSLPAPERFVGLHYFFPAAINPLIEVIAGEHTQEPAMEAALAFAKSTGKEPVRCRDVRGFAINRYFVPYVNEAVRLVDDGFAAVDVERVARTTFGTKAGPFKVMDLTKPELALHTTEILSKLSAFYAPAPGLRAKIAAGGLWDVKEIDEERGPRDRAIGERLVGAVFYAVLDELSQQVASPRDIDLGARIGLQWHLQPCAAMAAMGAEEVKRLVTAAAAPFGLAAPIALKDFFADSAMHGLGEGGRDVSAVG